MQQPSGTRVVPQLRYLPPPQMPPKRDEAALQEEEELQLAIALSQSEAEEKERMVRPTPHYELSCRLHSWGWP